MKERLELFKEKNLNITEYVKQSIAVVLFSISILFVLLDIKEVLSGKFADTIYLATIPGLLALLVKIFSSKNLSRKLHDLYLGCWVSIIEYLSLFLIGTIEFSFKVKIAIFIITILYMFWYYKENHCMMTDELPDDNIDEHQRQIFSLYYINTEKVYEIAMLLSNRIITGGSKERSEEDLTEKQTNVGISANLDYLQMVKSELGVSQNTQVQNSIKNRVLENFDVKTTKSNMLASIIARAKVFKDKTELKVGDLVLLKEARLELLNPEETYGVTKLLLNGAFNDTKVSSDSKDMKIELNLSAMINSLLKDCVYELGCTVKNDKFLLTIPMTFENDFENSYNIYDLQVGNVTVIGIYRGEKKYKNRLSLQEIFSEDNTSTKNTYDRDGYELKQSSINKAKNNFETIENKGRGVEEYQAVIDIIAVIQEINAN